MTATVLTRKQRHRRANKLNRKLRKAISLQVRYQRDSYGTGIMIYAVQGERIHEVRIDLKSDGSISCDCKNGSAPCSHVIAVRMHRKEWN
jgi:uncharacterized Zn finger protein